MKNHNYGRDVRRQVVRKRKPVSSDKKDLHLSPEGLPQFFSMQIRILFLDLSCFRGLSPFGVALP